MNENIELAWCEFTDDHDFAFFRYVKNLQFHHNFVDNFNDDGLYLYAGGKAGKNVRISQNFLSRCLSTFAFAGASPHTTIGLPRSLITLSAVSMNLRPSPSPST